MTTEVDPPHGSDVPGWLFGTDCSGGRCRILQGFPEASACYDPKRSHRSEPEKTVWQHVAVWLSASFLTVEHKRAAVEVIDNRGNEFVAVKPLQS